MAVEERQSSRRFFSICRGRFREEKRREEKRIFSCTDDVKMNVDKAERMVREAATKGADIILIQEFFEGYYFCQAQREDFFGRAKPREGHPTIQRMQKLAKELNVVIPVSFFEQANCAHFNSIGISDADGSSFKACPRCSKVSD